ncbi:MAG: imelysin family protein [Prevotella sp.]|nr:imelysin family protein [Prevotella sp.]
MKHIKNYYVALAMMGAVLCGGLTSCSDEDDIDTEVVNGTQEALDAACKQWKIARADWEKSEAFLFGAADEYSIDPHTDTWPVDQAALANVLRDNSIMSDIENKVKQLNSGLLGYHGIEYVLFREGKARDISQFTDLEYKYVCAVAKDLYQATCVLQTTWDGSKSGNRYNETVNYLKSHTSLNDDGDVTDGTLSYKNFGEGFKNTPSEDYESDVDATIQIIEGARDIISEVAGSKIGLPWSGQDNSYIESPYAYNSIIDFYDNIVGCKNALYGQFDATSPTENSLLYFCLNSDNTTLKSQAQKVQSNLDDALSKINNMKAPFALNYTDSSVKSAIDALNALDEALDAMESTLKGYAGNATVEAQCKVINANYVDNVVVKTYTLLCDEAEKLYNSIKNIKK